MADSRALETLEQDQGFYFGGALKSKMAAFRAAGKDHLCVCAHGPLHYYPFHLLGPEDQPLAAEWRVTYLPNLRLLARHQTGVTKTHGSSIELATLGVNFGKDNPHLLPVLEESEPEAQAIARVYNTTAIVGNAATESAVKEALAHSRRVHVSTHGRHNVVAPALQCLYVRPDEEDDGVIHAYELLRLDLHDLDLVTLSACTTYALKACPAKSLDSFLPRVKRRWAGIRMTWWSRRYELSNAVYLDART